MIKPKDFEVNDLATLKKVAVELDLQAPVVVFLRGDLGAGKTEFVRQFVHAQNAGAAVTSPTFSIHNMYELANGTTIHHLDLYRMKSEDDLEAVGFWDLFSEPAFIFVEWPDLIDPSRLEFPLVELEFKIVPNSEKRLIHAAWS